MIVRPLLKRRASGARRRFAGRALLAALVISAPLVQAPPAQAAGFQLVFNDDFTGTKINGQKWGVYNGGNGGNRIAAHTIVNDGKLILRNKKVNGVWKGAGVSAAPGNRQTYGKYEMRVRFDKGYGVRAVGLLWPTNGVWPPEVDWYEIPAGNTARTVNTLTNHYGQPGARRMMHAGYNGEFSQWQTVSVEWTPTRLVYKLNGVAKATMTQNIPRTSMWFGLQTKPGESHSGILPNASTPQVVDLEVDWVKIYRYTA